MFSVCSPPAYEERRDGNAFSLSVHGGGVGEGGPVCGGGGVPLDPASGLVQEAGTS